MGQAIAEERLPERPRQFPRYFALAGGLGCALLAGIVFWLAPLALEIFGEYGEQLPRATQTAIRIIEWLRFFPYFLIPPLALVLALACVYAAKDAKLRGIMEAVFLVALGMSVGFVAAGLILPLMLFL